MKPRYALTAVVLLLLLGACSSSGVTGSSGETKDPTGVEVAVANIAFEPATLEIGVGESVTWTSSDESVRHTVTSGLPAGETVPGVNKGASAKPDGIFDGELADAGSSFTFTFERAGTYAYFCEVHPSMTAEITVI